MNKRELKFNISVLSANNINIISNSVTIGWDVFLTCKKKKI